jgi:hypothetical protein
MANIVIFLNYYSLFCVIFLTIKTSYVHIVIINYKTVA